MKFSLLVSLMSIFISLDVLAVPGKYLCHNQDDERILLRVDNQRVVLTLLDQTGKPSFEGVFDPKLKLAGGTGYVRYFDNSGFSRAGKTEYWVTKTLLKGLPEGSLRIHVNSKPVVVYDF